VTIVVFAVVEYKFEDTFPTLIR